MKRIIAALACILTAMPALAQSTAFTYQGELKSGGTLVNGLHDLRFKLFDASTGSAQIGVTQCVDDVQVTDGKFYTTIDFGQQFATTSSRFLEIDVRQDGGLDCSNPGVFVTMSPRQEITPTPRATTASTAFSLSAPDGSPANAVRVANDGKVGIGTSSPINTLHIARAGPTIALQDMNPASQQAGYISYRDNANNERAWVGYGSSTDPDFQIINARSSSDIIINAIGGNIALAGGNVGIGTVTPASKLEVRGDVRLGPVGQYYAPAGEENLRIVRGAVFSDGNPQTGTGFTVTRTATGMYTVTFTQPFTAMPVVTATARAVPTQSVMNAVNIDNVTTGSFQVRVSFISGSLQNGPFHFIAIGPR